MAYAEKRGNLWRARWRGPDGRLEQKPGFTSKRDAVSYGRDQEAAIRNNTYKDPRAGRITLTEWVNTWFPALDLEMTTLSNYRYLIEVHILPEFGDRELASITPEEVAVWEKKITKEGYARRTARDARSTLITILEDAIPRHIQTNPAARRRGKGRKGQRRIERAEKRQKAWATPLQSLLVAERCAALSGSSTDFVMILTLAYTAMRWSEMVGLPPECVRTEEIDVHWKLYELNGRFYRGRPKDGSMRTVDIPPFLGTLLEQHLATMDGRACTCQGTEPPWCQGGEYAFLGPANGHFRRSNYSERLIRPAADGWYPGREGVRPRPAMPVLVDARVPYPGTPLPPWPAAVPGEPFVPPSGKGRPRLVNRDGIGRCAHCAGSYRLRLDGTVINHRSRDADGRCPGSQRPPGEDVPVASWAPILPTLTPHGLRHSHQPWMDDAGIPYVLQSERMGHEVPGMRGTYGHVSPTMRAMLVEALQRLWDESLRERARICPTSSVPVLDALLETVR